MFVDPPKPLIRTVCLADKAPVLSADISCFEARALKDRIHCHAHLPGEMLGTLHTALPGSSRGNHSDFAGISHKPQ